MGHGPFNILGQLMGSSLTVSFHHSEISPTAMAGAAASLLWVPLPSFFHCRREPALRLPAGVCCGLRDGPRKSLWRGRAMSPEAIQAVHALKLAKSSSSPGRVDQVFEEKFARLLKADQVEALAELRRQNELELALQVFTFIRKEVWYKPELSLYSDMILMAGKSKLIAVAEELFSNLSREGLKPDTRAYTEMIGAFLQVGMVEKAMSMYKEMKESGVTPDKLTLTILIRNLEKAGERELASSIRKECAEYVDYPEKLLQEIDKKYPKRRSLKLV